MRIGLIAIEIHSDNGFVNKKVTDWITSFIGWYVTKHSIYWYSTSCKIMILGKIKIDRNCARYDGSLCTPSKDTCPKWDAWKIKIQGLQDAEVSINILNDLIFIVCYIILALGPVSPFIFRQRQEISARYGLWFIFKSRFFILIVWQRQHFK